MEEFLFHNSDFENVVRKSVNIFDRSITEDDVKKRFAKIYYNTFAVKFVIIRHLKKTRCLYE